MPWAPAVALGLGAQPFSFEPTTPRATRRPAWSPDDRGSHCVSQDCHETLPRRNPVCRWERCSEALIVSTVPEILPESRAMARSRWTSLSAVVVPRSRLSCTRESAVLTLWPPGPEARETARPALPPESGGRGARRVPGVQAGRPHDHCAATPRWLPRSVPVGSSQAGGGWGFFSSLSPR